MFVTYMKVIEWSCVWPTWKSSSGHVCDPHESHRVVMFVTHMKVIEWSCVWPTWNLKSYENKLEVRPWAKLVVTFDQQLYGDIFTLQVN